MRTSLGPISGTGTSSRLSPGARSRFTKAGIVLLTSSRLVHRDRGAIRFWVDVIFLTADDTDNTDGNGELLSQSVLSVSSAVPVLRFSYALPRLPLPRSFRMFRQWPRRSSAWPRRSHLRRGP